MYPCLVPANPLRAIVAEGSHAVEDVVQGVDPPHPALAGRDLQQVAADPLPPSASLAAGADALAVVDGAAAVDPPHVTSGADADVLQLPVDSFPRRALRTDVGVKKQTPSGMQG